MDAGDLWGSVAGLKNFSTLLAVFGETNLKKTDAFDYKGIDSDAIIRKFEELAKRHKKVKKDLITDIRTICMIGLVRGNIRVDQLNRTVAAGKERIQGLVKTYEIYQKKNVNDRNYLKPDTLTFSRALNVFPHVASQLMHCYPTKFTRLPDNSPAYIAKSHRLPPAMKHTGFATMIPRSPMEYQQIMSIAHITFMVEFGYMINPKGRNTSFADAYERQEHFHNVDINSSISENGRIIFMKDFELDLWINFERIIEVANSALTLLGKIQLDKDSIKAELVKYNGSKISFLTDAAEEAELQRNAEIPMKTFKRNTTGAARETSSAAIATVDSGPVSFLSDIAEEAELQSNAEMFIKTFEINTTGAAGETSST